MTRGTVNGLLGLGVVVSLALTLGARGPIVRPNFEYLPNMVRTARYNAFEENPIFADGLTLRMPVTGTIPRGWQPLGDTNPYSASDRQAVERGARVFANFCQPCHGADAKGVGPVVKHGFPPPPPLARNQTQDKTDAQLFQVVTEGVQTMPAYALQLSRDDRWRVILHVRSFKRSTQP
jgi:mono/diheme cytochrome c family protein